MFFDLSRTPTSRRIFQACDEDAAGEIDVEEFVLMLQLMEIDMPTDRIRMLFAQLDKHGQGRITLDAIIDIFAPYQFVTNFIQKTLSSRSSQ